MKHVMTVVVVMLVASVPRAFAQAPQNNDTLWHSVAGTRSVSVVNRWQTTPLRGAYSVQVTDEKSGLSSEVALPNAHGAVSRIEAWNDRLIVIVRQRASVIDTATATVVDEFSCELPEFSADRRVMTYHPVSVSGEVSASVVTYELGPASQ